VVENEVENLTHFNADLRWSILPITRLIGSTEHYTSNIQGTRGSSWNCVLLKPDKTVFQNGRTRS
jgi:hypothetical protein